MLESVIDGLEKAHSKQVVHRDLNLKNILLGHDGDREFVKIVDFGIARLLDQFGTTHTSLPRIWTYPFVSPEHALNRDVQSSDYFVFGLIAASLLTWQVPRQDHVLESQDIEELLKPLSQYINDAYIKNQIHTLIVSLTNPEPLQRPIPASVKRILNEIKLEFTDRPELKLRVPRGVEEEIKTLEFDSVEAFFHDLNHSTMARYQTSQQEDQQDRIYFFGRSTWAATKSDKQSGDQEQLVLVKAGRNEPDEHRRRIRGASYCRYELKVGFGNSYHAMNEIYRRTLQNNELKELEKKKRDFFKASSFILDTLEERAKNMTFLYENLDTTTVSDTIRMTITGVSEFNIVTGQDTVKSVDEALETLLNMDSESAFSARVEQQRERTIGKFLAFNPETRILTLNPVWSGKIPKDGYLTSIDAGALVSIRRQRAALNRFIKDDTVNPQLGNLVLSPKENSRGLLPLVSLKQTLKSEAEVQEIVEHALAAQDFYFIQGPPGTGKTTLIIELMAQILERDKRAKVLLTAQPNEAVNHAFQKFRKLTNNHYRDLLFTKGADELSSNYTAWGRNVIAKSQEALDREVSTVPNGILASAIPILKDWQEKLLKTPDVLVDYARSVQVFGSTCLRVPQVAKLLGATSFDYVITDEAAKALDTEILTTLVEGRHFILVGDQRQLPPYIDQEMENTLEKNGYRLEEVKTSLFEKLFKNAPSTNKSVLRRQFRMHSTIGTDFVGRLFYGDLSDEDLGGLETGVDDSERDLNIPIMKLHKHRVLWFNVNGTEKRVRNTFYNPDEASKIAFLLREINKQVREAALEKLTVSVIAPYLAQVEKLYEEIVPTSIVWTHLDIQIPTVDSFQGKETDISVFSVVRTQGNMKFLSDRRRLNVSWSRAQRALFIFGDLNAAKANEQIAKAINILPPENLIGVR